jgi:hypothetical protein
LAEEAVAGHAEDVARKILEDGGAENVIKPPTGLGIEREFLVPRIRCHGKVEDEVFDLLGQCRERRPCASQGPHVAGDIAVTVRVW